MKKDKYEKLNKKLNIGLVIIFIIYLSIFIYYFFPEKNNHVVLSVSDNIEVVEISTEIVPYLEPHLHEIGDSAFDPEHHSWLNSDKFVFSEDIWIKGIDVKINNSIEQIIHHAALLSPTEPNEICPNALFGKEYFVTAQDVVRDKIILPEGYGMMVKKNTPLLWQVMIHNPFPPYGPGEAFENVSVSLLLDVVKVKKNDSTKELIPYRLHLEDEGCPKYDFQQVFEVPANTTNYYKDESIRDEFNPALLSFESNGIIFSDGGHLHGWEGGRALDIYKNNELIKKFIPEQIGPEEWDWSTETQDDNIINIKKGDEINIAALYDNPERLPVRGAMGMYMFFFAPEE